MRFDYRGHGESSGEFKAGTIGDWSDDVLAMIDHMVDGPYILVGSSMGGWLGLIAAQKRPQHIRAFIGVAAAPDFTENMILNRLTDQQKELLQRQGYIDDPDSPEDHRVPITLRLIEEARSHLQLRGPIPIECPVRLIQGMADAEVPWSHATQLAQTLTSQDVRVTFIKDGDHRLSRPQDLALLARTVDEFVA